MDIDNICARLKACCSKGATENTDYRRQKRSVPSSGEAKKLQLPELAAHGQTHRTPLDNTKHVAQMTLLELGESQYTKKGISLGRDF